MDYQSHRGSPRKNEMKAYSEKHPVILYSALVVSILLLSGVFVLWQTRKQQHLAETVALSALDEKISVATKALARPGKQQVKAYTALAALYVQKIRESADPSYYTTIDGLLDQAVLVDPNDMSIIALRAVIENGRHHFQNGYSLISQAIAASPDITSYYGIRADAEIELGKYAEAEMSLDHMVGRRPDFSSYTRIAYLRELYGDNEGAKEVLKSAISAGSVYKENIAWAHVELGKLKFRTDLDAAEVLYNRALEIEENYPPALEGLAKISFARGDPKGAIDHLSHAFARVPLAQYATLLGEVEESMGDTKKAAQEYALASVAYAKSSTSGINTDLEYSVFLSDHGDDALALTLARRAYGERPSVYGADALAWALYQNGLYEEAMRYTKEALRLGDNDPLIVFHAGMIAEANKDDIAAKKYFTEVQALSPNFSISYGEILKNKLMKP